MGKQCIADFGRKPYRRFRRKVLCRNRTCQSDQCKHCLLYTSGNTPIRDEIIKEIQKAIDDQETTLTLSDACYEKPSVTADDPQIADTVSQLDRYMAATVT